MRNLYKKYVALFVMMTLVSSCSPIESKKNQKTSEHNVTIEVQDVENSIRAKDSKELESLLKKIKNIAITESKKSTIDVDYKSLLTNVILPLRNVVLDVNTLLDPRVKGLTTKSGDPILSQLVVYFNLALLTIHKVNPESLVKHKIFKIYEKNIFWDCNMDLKGSCLILSQLGSYDSNQVTKIVKILFEREKRDLHQERLLFAAYELSRGLVDSDLTYMMAARLAQSLQLEKSGKITQKRRERDAYLFSNLLKLNYSDMLEDKKYKIIVENLKIEDLNINSFGPLSPSIANLIGLYARYVLYKDGKLNKKFQSYVKNFLYLDEFGNRGIYYIRENLRGVWTAVKDKNKQFDALSDSEKIKYSQIYSSFKDRVESSSNYLLMGPEASKVIPNLLGDVEVIPDEYFYLAHSLYFGSLETQEALKFWEHTKKDVKRLITEFINISKTQIAYNIVKTNHSMSDLYAAYSDYDLLEIMDESAGHSETIKHIWVEGIISKIGILNTFAYQVRGNPDNQLKKLLNQLELIKVNMPANLKYMLAYSNMFPLMHIVAKLKKKGSIQSRWTERKFEVHHTTIINNFFSGDFEPLFNFGNDGIELNTNQIIYTFYYAMMTEIFSVFEKNKSINNLNLTDFMKTIIYKIIDQTTEKVNDFHKSVNKVRNKNANKIGFIQKACEEEKIIGKQERGEFRGKLKDLGYIGTNSDNKFHEKQQYIKNNFLNSFRERSKIKTSVEFSTLDEGVYGPIKLGSGNSGGHFEELYNLGFMHSLREMRTRHDELIKVTEILIDLYKSYIGEGIEGLEGDYIKKLQGYKSARAELLNTFYSVFKEVSFSCEWDLMRRERDIKLALLFEEVKFLEKLFDQIYDVSLSLDVKQRSEVDINKALKTQAEFPLVDLESSVVVNAGIELNKVRDLNFKPISESNSSITEFKGKGRGTVEVYPDYINYRALDAYARLAHYMNTAFKGQYEISYNSFDVNKIREKGGIAKVSIDWKKDREEAKELFVKEGVQKFSTLVGDLFTEPIDINHQQVKIEILSELYKIGAWSKNADPSDEIFISRKFDIPLNTDKLGFMPGDKIVENYVKLIDFINISLTERVAFDYMGIHEKYKSSTYEMYIKREGEEAPMGIYDFLLKRTYSDNDATSYKGVEFFDNFKAFSETKRKSEKLELTFPYDPEIDEIIKKSYTKTLNHYMANVFDMIRSIENFDTGRRVESKGEVLESHLYLFDNENYYYGVDQNPFNLKSVFTGTSLKFLSEFEETSVISFVRYLETKFGDNFSPEFETFKSKMKEKYGELTFRLNSKFVLEMEKDSEK